MRCGLLGRRLGHSYSPQLHRFFGDDSYSLWEVEPQDLEDFLRKAPFHGLNVTTPYKRAVAPFCQALSETARRTGSVNTILRRPDGTLEGHNTDCVGFRAALDRCGVEPAGKKVLVLGSGGAAAAVLEVLRGRGARAVCISRRGPDHYGNLDRHQDAGLLVNATPVGMFPQTDRAPLDLTCLPRLEAVLDLIYNPARTRLLAQAEELGLAWENGLAMLAQQARRSAELFTGRRIPEAQGELARRALSCQMENWVLLGMPGCGKTTLGRALAAETGRPFVDTDQALEERTGQSVPALLAARGEAAFRDLETALLAEVGRGSGQVIATGGGCVLRPENLPLLRQNGRLLWVRRPLQLLETRGRPLSQGGDLEAMYRRRRDRYARFCSLQMQNTDTIAAGVRRAKEAFLCSFSCSMDLI